MARACGGQRLKRITEMQIAISALTDTVTTQHKNDDSVQKAKHALSMVTHHMETLPKQGLTK